MVISKLKIKNFKSFKEEFEIDFTPSVNIIVGLNEAGKSTILEAIHLACSGVYDGKQIRNEISQNLFNDEIIQKYIFEMNSGKAPALPEISIELVIADMDTEIYNGDKNSFKDGSLSGFTFKIQFNDSFQESYNEFIKNYEKIKSLPVEYYDVSWTTFARKNILPRDILLKSSLIDSSSIKLQSGFDVHFAKILRDALLDEDKVFIAQAHRKMLDDFRNDENVQKINDKINEQAQVSSKTISISVDLQTKNAWEKTLITLLDGIPYTFVGKGEQSIVKTNVALLSNKTKKAGIVLLEEPENHLTYSKLNSLIKTIKDNNNDKQIIITTHSSFIANKLGLNYIILVYNRNVLPLNTMPKETYKFFSKIAGYDTLRLILSRKIILVEGDSDELIVQRAYIDKFGCLPIENEIDVMSVGLSFLRFLDIATKVKNNVVVVTDNDGDIDALQDKYTDYIGLEKKPGIKICFDDTIDNRTELNGQPFNYNTLEPLILKYNDLKTLNEIFETQYTNEEDLLKYMKNNKTDVALKIFESEKCINYPTYILKAFEDSNE